MRLKGARLQNFRCARGTGWSDVQHTETILVGPNEADNTGGRGGGRYAS